MCASLCASTRKDQIRSALCLPPHRDGQLSHLCRCSNCRPPPLSGHRSTSEQNGQSKRLFYKRAQIPCTLTQRFPVHRPTETAQALIVHPLSVESHKPK